jgi:hypothetical protein
VSEKQAKGIPAEPLKVEQSLRSCPQCDYDRGFHVALERTEGPQGANVLVKLICPGCAAVYDVGLHALLA